MTASITELLVSTAVAKRGLPVNDFVLPSNAKIFQQPLNRNVGNIKIWELKRQAATSLPPSVTFQKWVSLAIALQCSLGVPDFLKEFSSLKKENCIGWKFTNCPTIPNVERQINHFLCREVFRKQSKVYQAPYCCQVTSLTPYIVVFFTRNDDISLLQGIATKVPLLKITAAEPETLKHLENWTTSWPRSPFIIFKKGCLWEKNNQIWRVILQDFVN